MSLRKKWTINLKITPLSFFSPIILLIFMAGCSSGGSGSSPGATSNSSITAIEITPINDSSPIGLKNQYTATAIYEDNSTKDVTTEAIWNSSNPSVASISNVSGSNGMATSIISGTTNISATFNKISSNTTLLTVTGNIPSTILLSAYKDVGISMNWWDPAGQNTYVMSSTAGSDNLESSLKPLSSILPIGMKTVTWAFATGSCTNENWAGISALDFAHPNILSFSNSQIGYILSTGGAAGIFTCDNVANMKAFLDRYSSTKQFGINSEYLVGIDFDIEGHNLTTKQIKSLVNSIAGVKSTYPEYANLRVSFTLATLAASDGSMANINSEGEAVMAAISTSGLQNYYINLMTMDYGTEASAGICVVNKGVCDMGHSAIQAANNFAATHKFVPLNHIELTPLLGINDIPDEIFTLDDATIVANYVRDHQLGGLHYWSFDRDASCINGFSDIKTVCNGNTTKATGNLPFAKTFINGLQ